MIDITRLLHVGLLVSDLERAKNFYETVLGLREMIRPPLNFPGAWYDLGDGLQLHLMAVKDPNAPVAGELTRDRHISFAVEDYQGAIEHLRQLGIPFRESRSAINQIFFRDPDGNLIELQKVVRQRTVRTRVGWIESRNDFSGG